MGVVPPSFISEWIPAEKLIQALHTIQMPLRYRLQLLERLAQEPTLEPRLQAAESPETPLTVLEQLAGDLDLPVRLAVKSNPSCPPELIELVEGQYAIASDWNGDREQLAVLGRSRWAWIRLAVAQNPHAPQETLMELARDEVYILQFAVAKNPGTSPEILGILAGYEDSKIQNAIAERADSTEEIMHQLFPSQESILRKKKNLPTSILERFFSDRGDELKYLFLSHSNTPTWILAQLAQVDLEQLRVKVIEQIEASPIVKSIEEGMLDATRFLADIAKHPQVSTEILEHLTVYPNPDVQLAVAQNHKTPGELRKRLLEQLVNSSNLRIKIKLASDPTTPVEILEKLAEVSSLVDKMTSFLRQLAPNITDLLANKIRKFIDKHHSPELVLFSMRQSRGAYIRTLQEWDEIVNSLEESEKTTLEYLVTQEWSGEWKGKFTAVRKGRGRSRDLPKDKRLVKVYHQLESLLELFNMPYNSDRSNEDVIAALLGNPSTPETLRSRLWEQCKKAPDELGRYLQDGGNLRMALAFNPNVSEPEQNSYFQNLIATGKDTGEKLAKDPQTPAHILKKLAEFSDNIIRYYVAKNLSTPTETLIKLTDDMDLQVKECALKNPNIPQLEAHRQMQLGVYRTSLGLNEAEKTAFARKLIVHRRNNPYDWTQKNAQNRRYGTSNEVTISPTLRSLNRLYNPNMDDLPTLLSEYAQSENAFVRFITFMNPQTPLENLSQTVRSSSWLERYAVAENTAISTETRLFLTQDSNRIVKAAALANL